MTVDKLVCEMPLGMSMNTDQTPESNKGHIRRFGPNEGIMLTDIDNFMPRGNPIVNFPNVWPPEEEATSKQGS